MAKHVSSGACLKCPFGAAPVPINVLPQHRVMSSNLPAATIMDNKMFLNVVSFGVCRSLTNPLVIAATSAAGGALTPMPCIPVLTAPWVPGNPRVLLGNMPALNKSSKLICAYGGVISLQTSGQVTEDIG